ncbi:MAG: lipase family protein [Planctomycetota bacterium]
MLNEAIGRVDQIQDPGEVAVKVHSNLAGPISELTFLQRSLLFAELAMLSYNDEDEATRAAALLGFEDVTFYDRDGSQAYRFRSQHDCVVACRGTEPNEWNDIKADANAASVVAETAGRVHRGFKQEVDDLWPMLETALIHNDQPLFFCGHSLGGAMATICAGRCFLSHIESDPEQLFTYGSPRVGNKIYINHIDLEHYRYVNNNDIVTRVPPSLLGYRHCGRELYLDRHGKPRRLNLIMRRRDRWRGFLGGLKNWKVDHFSDHSIHRYIDALVIAVEEEQAGLREGTPPVDVDDIGAKV